MTGAGKTKRQYAMRLLMEKASIQGYLTTDDLIELFPDTSEDMERLSVLLVALRRQGIEVVDSEDQLDPATAPETLDQPQPEPVSNNELNTRLDASISQDDTIGMYLQEMSRVPLLTVEEELNIAIRIETGRKAKEEKII